MASSLHTSTAASRWCSERFSPLRLSSARFISNSTKSAVRVPPACAKCPSTLDPMIIVATLLHGRMRRR